jgi:hypothetical protein
MRYGPCLLLLASLSSCYQADSAGVQQHSSALANPLLGHWQSDSIATVPVDKQGRLLGKYQVEHIEITLDITPTQYIVAVGIGFSDTATCTYTRHGQDLVTTLSLLNRKPIPGLSGKVEHTQITTLTPTVFRTEKTLSIPTGQLLVRHFFHR